MIEEIVASIERRTRERFDQGQRVFVVDEFLDLGATYEVKIGMESLVERGVIHVSRVEVVCGEGHSVWGGTASSYAASFVHRTARPQCRECASEPFSDGTCSAILIFALALAQERPDIPKPTRGLW